MDDHKHIGYRMITEEDKKDTAFVKRYIAILLRNIDHYQKEIKAMQSLLSKDIKEIQSLCPHENIIELPAAAYHGIAATYARRLCSVCKLEEAADNSGHFHKLTHADYIVNSFNQAIGMAEFAEFREWEPKE